MTSIESNDTLWERFKSRFLIILFSLPFAAVGVGMLAFLIVPDINRFIEMKSWNEGQANLTSAGYHSYQGDDSTTYRAYATYHYHYKSQRFDGDRVGISDMSDNIGDFHQEIGNKLERAFKSNQSVPVWINPNNPSEAVLHRDIRWGLVAFQMVFVVVFGGVGLGMMGFSLLKPKKEAVSFNTLNSHHSYSNNSNANNSNSLEQSPWLSNSDWSSPVIYSSAKTGLWVIWIFAIFWNAIAMPTGILVIPEIQDGNYPAALGLLFPLIGLGLLFFAIRLTMAWNRYGKSPLNMDPYPGSIGGQVGAWMLVNVLYQNQHTFKVYLSCLYSYISGSGKNRSRKERVIWQTDGCAKTTPFDGKTRLEILFNVDDGLPASQAQSGSSYHLWRLSVEADLPGIDYNRSFELPVFPTAKQATSLRHLSTDHQQAAENRLQEIEDVMDLQQIPGGVKIFYPAFKKPLGKLMAIIFGALFFGGGFLAYLGDAPIMFPIVFCGIGGLIAIFGAIALCSSLEVKIDHQQLKTIKSILGLQISQTSVERAQIINLTLKESYSSSSGNKHTTFFKIQAISQDEKKYDVGINLAGRSVAEQALESLSLLTGIPAKNKP